MVVRLVLDDSDTTVVGSSCLANGDDGSAISSSSIRAAGLAVHCSRRFYSRRRTPGRGAVAALAMGMNGACKGVLGRCGQEGSSVVEQPRQNGVQDRAPRGSSKGIAAGLSLLRLIRPMALSGFGDQSGRDDRWWDRLSG